MNLNDVMKNSQAQELMREIMTEVGLGDVPSSYGGDSAFKTRCNAANQLAPTILARSQAGATISPPNDEIIKVVTSTAKTLEKSQTELTLTYEVMRIAIFGHIWIGHLIARRARSFNRTMAKDGTLSILMGLIGFGSSFGGGCSSGGGGDCGSCNSGGDCGGCGSGGCGP